MTEQDEGDIQPTAKITFPGEEKTGPRGEAARSSPATRSRRWPGLIALLALSLVLAGTGAGYRIWQHLTTQLAQAQAERRELAKRIATVDLRAELKRLASELQAERAALQTLVDAQQRRLEALEAAVAKAHELAARPQRDWVVAEVEYLVGIAQQRLTLMRDPHSALRALQGADRRLAALADPALVPVREALGKDVEALRTVSSPDLSAIADALSGLAERVDGLALRRPPVTDKGQAVALVEPSEPETATQRFVLSLMRELNKHIAIRRHEAPLAALGAAETRLYARQVLRLHLESVRLAALLGDDPVFHRQLRITRDWVHNYYQDEATQGFVKALSELDRTNIAPPLPQVTQTVAALEQFRAQHAQPEEE